VRRATPGGLLGAIGWQHGGRQREVMHAANVADQVLDHRVIEAIGQGEKPALLGLRQQAAEQVAQRLGVGAAAGRSGAGVRSGTHGLPGDS